MRYLPLRSVYLAPVLAALVLTAGLIPSAARVVSGQDSNTPTPNPSGFVGELVVEGLDWGVTDFAFAPDGRIFVTTLAGFVVVIKDGVRLPKPFIQLPVNSLTERGLIGLALDPSFQTNGYVYLFYTYEHDPSDHEGPKTNRLVRVTAEGDVAFPGSEVILLGTVVGEPSRPSCSDFPAGADCLPADGKSHIGGSLGFSSDGKLFVGTGEASNQAPDYLANIMLPFNLDSLAGKILRINPDGSAPPDNPFYTGDPTANRSKVWSYGLRQPFRMAVQPGTDLPFVGDVGASSWEEINVAVPGANFGWPCYEGAGLQPTLSKLDFCQDLIEDGPAETQPLYAYAHDGESAAVTAGVFYQGTNYPARFNNAFFFGDWAQSWISVLKVDDDNDLVDGSVEVILSDAGRPIDFEVGPDGDIYYLTSGGKVWHLRYIGSVGGSDSSGANTGIVVAIAAAVAIAVVAAGVVVLMMMRKRRAQL